MNKKIIGITGASQFTPQVREMVEKYFKAIPLDIMQNGSDDLTRIASVCDGFIFAGGVDICPTSLEHEKREVQNGLGYTKFDVKRDKRELTLIEIAAAQKKNIFGICRGHQMLLAHAGLHLIADISRYSEVCHNPRDIEMQGEPVHFIEGVGNGIKEFAEQTLVNSYHHQAIRFDGKVEANLFGVEVLATSHTIYADHKTPEELIVELARGAGFLSCQWHPEADWNSVESSEKVLGMAKQMFGIK